MNDRKRILIFRTGALGDMLSLVPSLWGVRERYPRAHITLLFDACYGQNRISPQQVFAGSGLVDDYLVYPSFPGRWGRMLQPAVLLGLLARIRRGNYDTLIHLARTLNQEAIIRRDLLFFRRAGFRDILGVNNLETVSDRTDGRPLPRVKHQADLTLSRLAGSGFQIPPPGRARIDINLQPAERERIRQWKQGLPDDGGRPWLAIGPGSKMPAKIWPVQRYAAAVRQLIDEFDLWPVVFGGGEDREKGDYLLARWGRGVNAAGELSIRESTAALETCAMYLGNDTGTMHLAAAAGIRCVAVFSSRDFPGKWYPYGPGHIVLRTPIACEGCILEKCTARQKRCILAITVEEVTAAIRRSWCETPIEHAKA